MWTVKVQKQKVYEGSDWRKAIDKKYKKPGLANELVIKSKSVCHWTDQEIETMHKYYKAACRELRESKGMI